jgi:hypothetical protein
MRFYFDRKNSELDTKAGNLCKCLPLLAYLLACSISLAATAVGESVEIEFADLGLLEFLGHFATDGGK